MNIRFSTVSVALGCVFLASCYPYNENRGKKSAQKPAEKTVSSADQQKLQAQRDQLKKQEDLKKDAPKEELPQTQETPGGVGNGATTPGATETKPPVEKKRDYAFASKVPGKEGFVFSPYNNKIIDVRDMPSGTLVSDPTYPESEKKYFRVP